MNFYLLPLQDVENNAPKIVLLSQSTIALCNHALIPAENRDLWVNDLQELDDSTWEIAEDFLTLAYNELGAEYQPQTPVYVGEGMTQYAAGGWYVISSTGGSGSPGDNWMWLNINQDGYDWGADVYRMSAFPVGLVNGVFDLVDRNGDYIDTVDYVDNECIADLGSLWLWSDTDPFYLALHISSEVCP